jgi:hypothetical protein
LLLDLRGAPPTAYAQQLLDRAYDGHREQSAEYTNPLSMPSHIT